MRKLSALFFLLLASCAETGGRNVCPEYRNVRCLSELVCKPTSRGCDSCECVQMFEPARAGEGDKQ